ncbi:MAG: YtxH domain-containing protein [Elusimicrobia bacterium]|nr:YtxH domain-containing protein [Elusimicrobiota bacterium]
MSENKWLPYFVAGLGAGALFGVLFAPRPGKETREKIGDWLKQKRHETEETLHELREKAGIQRDKLAAAVKAGREAYKQNDPNLVKS